MLYFYEGLMCKNETASCWLYNQGPWYNKVHEVKPPILHCCIVSKCAQSTTRYSFTALKSPPLSALNDGKGSIVCDRCIGLFSTGHEWIISITIEWRLLKSFCVHGFTSHNTLLISDYFIGSKHYIMQVQ